MTNSINSNYLICPFCGASLSINDKTCNACEKNLYHTDDSAKKDNVDDKVFRKYNKSDATVDLSDSQNKIPANVTFTRSIGDIALNNSKHKYESTKNKYTVIQENSSDIEEKLNFKIVSNSEQSDANTNLIIDSPFQFNNEQLEIKNKKEDSPINDLNLGDVLTSINLNNASNVNADNNSTSTNFDSLNKINIENIVDSVKETLRTIYGTEVNDEIIFKALQAVIYGLSGDDNIISGDFNDIIYGCGGNDTIDGGLGTNTLFGGAGNDTYLVNSLSDLIVEYLNEGTDLVKSVVSYILGANLENLTLLGQSNINGTGNSLDNIIIGNSGNNILSGNEGNDTLDGGAGADTMIGGASDDTYTVDNVNDVVTELLN